MAIVFYVAAAIAILATLLTITARAVVHGLLNLVVSLLAMAIAFYTLGAPFAAAVEVILYAGAILVLFLFAGMLLGRPGPGRPRPVPELRAWLAPSILGLALIIEVLFLLERGAPVGHGAVEPRLVAEALYGPYVIGTEAASLLLFAGLVGVFHLGRREQRAP
jgi:NADH-quinone oxidoreductase subunit J